MRRSVKERVEDGRRATGSVGIGHGQTSRTFEAPLAIWSKRCIKRRGAGNLIAHGRRWLAICYEGDGVPCALAERGFFQELRNGIVDAVEVARVNLFPPPGHACARSI